jgi:hypothetical protein
MKLNKKIIKKRSLHKKVKMIYQKNAGKWANFSNKGIKLIDDNPFLKVRGWAGKLKVYEWIKTLKEIKEKKTLKAN